MHACMPIFAVIYTSRCSVAVAHVATCEPSPAWWPLRGGTDPSIRFVSKPDLEGPPIPLFGPLVEPSFRPRLMFPVAPRVCYIWNLFGMAGRPRSRRSSFDSEPREGGSELLTSLLNKFFHVFKFLALVCLKSLGPPGPRERRRRALGCFPGASSPGGEGGGGRTPPARGC
jgi:hypothetical protein